MRKLILTLTLALLATVAQADTQDYWYCAIPDGGHVYLTQINSGYPMLHYTNSGTPKEDLFLRASEITPAYYWELRYERYLRFLNIANQWSYVIQSGERNSESFNRITIYNEDGHQIMTDDCMGDVDDWFPTLWVDKGIVDEYDDTRITSIFSNVDEIW